MAWTTCRIADLHVELALVVLATASRGHLTREHPWRNNVDSHFHVLERGGQHPTQVRGCCFRRRICELAIAGSLHGAGNGGDVDDLAAVTRRLRPALGQQRQESHGHEELASDVSLEGVQPRLIFTPKEMLRYGVCIGHFGLPVARCRCQHRSRDMSRA